MLAIAFAMAGVLVLAFCLPFAAMLPFIIKAPTSLDESGDFAIVSVEIAAPFVAVLTIGLAARCFMKPVLLWSIFMVAPATIWIVGMSWAVGRN
ncbi:hypothetical protein F4U96_20510 [Sphingobium limneticum]|uniref:Uncharacterized protein n=2 Tax=Sphingomonadaceae TaxID=41297 RepID=A0A5J5HS03_9SPHN|nr:hypothetical protein F4U96_20510 [Sphingobium limneticum]KAA9025039.1 hypothetical protein F4U95_20625 [Sphingobium limneticum]BBD02635.1 hypothetical protein YGS_C2P0649 [Sphingobium sp. YG1]